MFKVTSCSSVFQWWINSQISSVLAVSHCEYSFPWVLTEVCVIASKREKWFLHTSRVVVSSLLQIFRTLSEVFRETVSYHCGQTLKITF